MKIEVTVIDELEKEIVDEFVRNAQIRNPGWSKKDILQFAGADALINGMRLYNDLCKAVFQQEKEARNREAEELKIEGRPYHQLTEMLKRAESCPR